MAGLLRAVRIQGNKLHIIQSEQHINDMLLHYAYRTTFAFLAAFALSPRSPLALDTLGALLPAVAGHGPGLSYTARHSLPLSATTSMAR